MKLPIHNSKFIIATILVAMFAACTHPAIDESKLFLSEQQAQDLIATGECITIEELKARYMTEQGNYCDESLYRERSKAGNYYLFSIDTIPVSTTPIYIRGRVTTDDYAGNFYKTLCIQQLIIEGGDTTQQALRLSVDLGSANGLYPIGQEILIRVDGLAIGRYANQPQLCLPSYNNNNYANYAEQKVGWAAGRIPSAFFKARTKCIGLPDVSKLYYEEVQITDFCNITDLEQTRKLDAKLVRIKNVHYTGEYEDGGKCVADDPETNSNANVFAPTTENLNYPQTRLIEDGNGNKTGVSTSEYAKFAHFYIPGADKNGIANCKKYNGYVMGILGFYYDNGTKYDRYPPASDDWSITIRSLDDLQLYYDANGNYLLDEDERTADNLWPRIEYTK